MATDVELLRGMLANAWRVCAVRPEWMSDEMARAHEERMRAGTVRS